MIFKNRKVREPKSVFGRPEVDTYEMFACILYGFAMGFSSLRNLEPSCLYDVRFIHITSRHHKYKGTLFYLVENCSGCQFIPYCRQFMKEPEGAFKVFEINPVFQRQKQRARDLLLSVEGIEMRVNRSCQAEGGFGVLKQDMSYEKQVSVEFMLTALGHNIRKYLRYSEKGLSRNVWTAQEGTSPERFKKPSAKRLANCFKKRQEKSVNEIARDYNYKRKKRL